MAALTKEEIIASINRLQQTLTAELSMIMVPPATLQQRDDAVDLTKRLLLKLNQAKADVIASNAPGIKWNDWIDDSIVPDLKLMSKLVNQVVPGSAPLGLCTYDSGSFCSTQAECDLPNSNWVQGAC